TTGLSLQLGRFLPDELRPRFARFVRDTYGERARALGWEPRPGEDEETRLLRPGLLSLVANLGEDPGLTAQARQLTERWLADRRAIDSQIAGAALRTAA